MSAGKGDKWVKGADLKKYRDAEYWKELEKRKEAKKQRPTPS